MERMEEGIDCKNLTVKHNFVQYDYHTVQRKIFFSFPSHYHLCFKQQQTPPPPTTTKQSIQQLEHVEH